MALCYKCIDFREANALSQKLYRSFFSVVFWDGENFHLTAHVEERFYETPRGLFVSLFLFKEIYVYVAALARTRCDSVVQAAGHMVNNVLTKVSLGY